MPGKKRVFLGFAAAPLIGGLLMGVIFNVMTFVAFVSNPKLMAEMRLGEGFLAMLVYPIGFELIFFLPCMLLALLAVLFKLQRTWRGCVAAGLAGGCIGSLWVVAILNLLMKGNWKGVMPSLGDGVLVFGLPALACALSACFALPRFVTQSVADPGP